MGDAAALILLKAKKRGRLSLKHSEPKEAKLIRRKAALGFGEELKKKQRKKDRASQF